MALVMAEAITRQWSVERTILASTVLPVVASGALMALLISSVDLLGAVKQHFEEDLGQALRQLLSDEGGLSDETLRTYVQEIFETVVQLIARTVHPQHGGGSTAQLRRGTPIVGPTGGPATAPDDDARAVEGSGSLRLGVDRERYQLFCAASRHADRRAECAACSSASSTWFKGSASWCSI